MKQQNLPLSELIKPKPKPKAPASELMKKVAEKAYNPKNASKVFSEQEMQDILKRRNENQKIEPAERVALKEQYRKIKRFVSELERDNQQKVIIFPSLTNGTGWYKAIQFSALYYAYRLADRIGRHARVLKDSDNFSKANFTVSITNIDRLVEQFKRFDEPTLEITENGIYIFTLKKPLSDDEVGQLRLIEETRRERMHNVLRPKAMDPATFNAILMIDRQILPRIKKLETPYFNSLGCKIVNDMCELLAIYNQFADGLTERKDAGTRLIEIVDSIIAGITLLSELRIWPYDVAAVIGENVNQVKNRIKKDFCINTGREKNG